jgi:3-oxoacyl-(acyl-carrier-protein) synthase
MAENRVVITGVGIVCSLGSDVSEVWEALLSGKTGIRPIEGFDPGGFGCTFAAGPWNPVDRIHPDSKSDTIPIWMKGSVMRSSSCLKSFD